MSRHTTKDQMLSRVPLLLIWLLLIAHAFGEFDPQNPAHVRALADLRRKAAYLREESRDDRPGTHEEARWPHYDDCFNKVTIRTADGGRELIDWTQHIGWEVLENKESPDQTQRAAFMRRVGEVVERWAMRQDASDRASSYRLAAEQWQKVLEYIEWEKSVWDEQTATAVFLELRKLRDLASYNRIYCEATASEAPFDQLEAFKRLTVEDIGPKTLREWRKLLVARFRMASGAAVARSSNDPAKGEWRALLDAYEKYVEEVRQHPRVLRPLESSEKRQFEADGRALPRAQTSSSGTQKP